MKNELDLINEEQLEERVYIIRNQEVMLDSDLAQIYGYTTKAFNQQVQRNIDKFDQDFMFKLTKEEYYRILRSQNVTLELEQGKYSKYLPYVFTEQGIYMLMTILRGEKATQQSKNLIRLFKRMKDYISITSIKKDQHLLRITNQVNENTNNIKELKNDIKELNNSIFGTTLNEITLLNGEVVESNIVYTSIYKQAKEKIYIIDNYISIKTLINLKEIENKEIIIFTDNVSHHLTKLEYLEFIKEYPNIKIKFIKTNNLFHDRYIIIDYKLPSERIYLTGSSSKDSGKEITTIKELDNISIFDDIIKKCLNNDELVLI